MGRVVRKILVAVGAGRGSEPAVSDALQLAHELGASIIYLHVVTAFDQPIIDAPARAYLSPEQLQSGLNAIASPLFAEVIERSHGAGVETSYAVTAGISIAQGITKFARQQACDLIVIGACNCSSWRRLLGGCTVNALTAVAGERIWVSSGGQE